MLKAQEGPLLARKIKCRRPAIPNNLVVEEVRYDFEDHQRYADDFVRDLVKLMIISKMNSPARNKPSKEYFEKLSSGGKVLMPLSSVPWSSCFGLLVDKYGISWKFNSDADKFLNTILDNKQ